MEASLCHTTYTYSYTICLVFRQFVRYNKSLFGVQLGWILWRMHQRSASDGKRRGFTDYVCCCWPTCGRRSHVYDGNSCRRAAKTISGNHGYLGHYRAYPSTGIAYATESTITRKRKPCYGGGSAITVVFLFPIIQRSSRMAYSR